MHFFFFFRLARRLRVHEHRGVLAALLLKGQLRRDGALKDLPGPLGVLVGHIREERDGLLLLRPAGRAPDQQPPVLKELAFRQRLEDGDERLPHHPLGLLVHPQLIAAEEVGRDAADDPPLVVWVVKVRDGHRTRLCAVDIRK